MSDFPFDIVGFDLDGTLCDTAPDLGAAVNHALVGAGRAPVPVGEVRNLIGGGARLMLSRALALSGGASEDEADALFHVLMAHYQANIAVHTRPYPGCIAALDALAQRGVKLAVVTNKAEPLALRLLDALGLADRFSCMIGRGSTGIAAPKPAPDPLLAMRARLGQGAAAYVGDSTFDVRAARAARLPVVAVTFGYNDVSAERLGADALIDHFDELVPTLARLT